MHQAAVARAERAALGGIVRKRLGERGAAELGGVGGDLGPRRRGPGEPEPLSPLDVEVGDHRQLVEALDPLGADGRADVAGEAHERLDQRHPRRVVVDVADQRPVELDDVGAHPHQLLEAGVAGAGVVDRDLRAALAQVGERPPRASRRRERTRAR